MQKLYDWECPDCGIFEMLGHPEDDYTQCQCGRPARKVWTKVREHIRFPEGGWDIGTKENMEIRSRRQLREEFERHNDQPDDTKHSYPKYLDGYGGY